VSTEWIVLVGAIKYVVTMIKGVYVHVFRSTSRRYFRERQHGPAWKCIFSKNEPTKNAGNHGHL